MEKKEYYLGKFKILFGKTRGLDLVVLKAEYYTKETLVCLKTFSEEKPVIIVVENWASDEQYVSKAGYRVFKETSTRRVVGSTKLLTEENLVKDIIGKFSFYSPNDDPLDSRTETVTTKFSGEIKEGKIIWRQKWTYSGEVKDSSVD